MENELRPLLLMTLRNQEVMINALATLLTDEQQDEKGQQRDNILADLATCAGLTHYLIEDLSNQDELRR